MIFTALIVYRITEIGIFNSLFDELERGGGDMHVRQDLIAHHRVFDLINLVGIVIFLVWMIFLVRELLKYDFSARKLDDLKKPTL
ncbi:MAG: hypothetical protein WDO13_18210 [Verrucomicrobiota bacterium]